MEWNSLREQGHGTSEANAAIRSEARGVVAAETGQPWRIRSWFKSSSSPPQDKYCTERYSKVMEMTGLWL